MDVQNPRELDAALRLQRLKKLDLGTVLVAGRIDALLEVLEARGLLDDR